MWHSRPFTPTRRVALGHLVLPSEPPPGFGGLLLGAVVAGHLGDLDPDLLPDLHRLITEVERGQRIVQPRLRHRFQVDRHGLARSPPPCRRRRGHQFELENNGSPSQQVLGAVYAAATGRPRVHAVAAVLHKAMRWRGPIGPSLVSYLAGVGSARAGSLWPSPTRWRGPSTCSVCPARSPAARRSWPASGPARESTPTTAAGGGQPAHRRPLRGPPHPARMTRPAPCSWPPAPGRAASTLVAAGHRDGRRPACRSPAWTSPTARPAARAPDRPPVLLAAGADEAAAAIVAARTSEPTASPSAAGRWAGGCARWRWPTACPRRPWCSSATRSTRRGSPSSSASSTCPGSTVPCLFISGTRDAFGTPDELEAATATIPGPVTHLWVEGRGPRPEGRRRRAGVNRGRLAATPSDVQAVDARVLGVEVLQLVVGRLRVERAHERRHHQRPDGEQRHHRAVPDPPVEPRSPPRPGRCSTPTRASIEMSPLALPRLPVGNSSAP